jgi:phosphatidate phosphatase APP1
MPLKMMKTLTFHARQQAEHFITEGVSRWFDTLSEAVADFAIVMDD